jgi:urease accessory protein UreE
MLEHYVGKLARALARGNFAGPDGQSITHSSRPHGVGAASPHLGTAFWALLVCAGLLLPASPSFGQPFKFRRDFNRPGNLLIADQFNNRVIEVTPAGDIVWSFGLGPNDFSAASVIGCNDSQRVGPFTLMAGTGTPAGAVPQAPNGAVDNRVILVNPAGKIVWQYGQFGQTGMGSNLLNTPVQCTWLPNAHVLITDQGNNRIIEVNLKNEIVWQYPGPNPASAELLSSPNSAELLENGDILIADEGNSRAIEVTRADHIVMTYTDGGMVGAVAFASRLEDGNTLLTDAGNSRAVEVDANDNFVWEYVTNKNKNSVLAPQPTRAVRLRDGDTLISDQYNNRVIRVTHAKDIVASYGLPLAGGPVVGFQFGNNFGYGLHTTQKGLYSPYDAKVVGDYTGLTPPFDFDEN